MRFLGIGKKEEPLKLEAPKARHVCLSNNYCRTRSFSDLGAEGALSTYYEAVMNDDNTWDCFRVNETTCVKTGKVVAEQIRIKTGISFDVLLHNFYMFENGAEALNQVFSNTKEDLGLDHFHILTHAEGLAFNTDGNLVETKNGRIISQGKFTTEEKDDVLKAYQDPIPSKKLPRKTLSDIFGKTMNSGKSLRLDRIIQESIDNKNAIAFMEHVIDSWDKTVEEIDEIIRKINNEMAFTPKSNHEWKYHPNIVSRGKEKTKGLKVECLVDDNYGRLTVFPTLLESEGKKENIVFPPEVYRLLGQAEFFYHYLIAKCIYQSISSETKVTFTLAKNNLTLSHSKLHSSDRPDINTVLDSVLTKNIEAPPEIMKQISVIFSDIKKSYEDAQRDLMVRTEKRMPPQRTGEIHIRN